MNPLLLLSRVRVVLCRPAHPGNIGAAARAMKTMGLTRLHLVSPKSFPDQIATDRAAGADDLLQVAQCHESLDEALSGVHFALGMSARTRDLGPQEEGVRDGVQRIIEEAAIGDVALVFGNEATGMSNEELLRCHATAKIPTDPDFSSLNLGAAVQVLAYEVRMAVSGVNAQQASTASRSLGTPATNAELEGLYGHLQQLMTETGFFNPEHPGRLMQKIRKLFGRSRLERDEVNILRGVLSSAQRPTGHAGCRPKDKLSNS